MGTYVIPRNLRGETRILYIFTVKSLITTAIGALIGFVFYFILSTIMGLGWVGIITMASFALVGFAVGAIKIPTIPTIAFTKNIGGESIDEIVKRYVMFKMHKKHYTYTKEKGE